MAYPVSQGHLINFIGFHSEPEKEGAPLDGKWSSGASREEVIGCYRDWEPQVQALMEVSIRGSSIGCQNLINSPSVSALSCFGSTFTSFRICHDVRMGVSRFLEMLYVLQGS